MNAEQNPTNADRDVGMIFLDFFYLLRAQGVPVSVREWLTWLECMDKGLIAADLGRAYTVGRAVMIKHERHLGSKIHLTFFEYYSRSLSAPGWGRK